MDEVIILRPDFLTIKRNRKKLRHSAKGSTWEDHKYIKRIDGTYYYPDSYEGGRHLPDGEQKTSDKEDSSEETKREKLDLTSEDIDRIAQEVIRGNFGNGQDRKDLLGENYQEIQDRVNQILRGSGVSKQKVSDASQEIIEDGKKAINEIVNKKETKTPAKKGIDLNRVYNVYRKR